MKIITNSTNTQAVGIGDTTVSVALRINQTEEGYTLSVRLSGMFLPDFEIDETLEGIQIKAATILEALGD